MKKITLLLFSIVLASCVKANDGNIHDLKWKLRNNEIVEYKTIMQVVEQSNDFIDELFKDIKGFESKDYSFFKEEMDKINKDFENTKMKTLLYKDELNIVQIKMLAEFENTQDDESLFKKLIDLNDGVVLRGAVNPEGSIQSFWLKSGQKNMISMFFELPSQTVQVGDKWELDINFIGNDQNFICKQSNKVNEVTLLDVVSKEGKEIALLKYKIDEYVFGNFNSPISKSDEKTELKMRFTYEALAEFSITDGRWEKYDGVLTQEMSGYMDNIAVQKISLISE